ncbi:MAG: serine/threonine-protein kinase, partial [Gemmatimonadota bacterium]
MNDVLERLQSALADRYSFERELGRGGMATVYLARDLKHDRDVAIKVFHPELAALIGGDRFFREIHIVAKLSHPRILTLHDSGRAGGFLFYVMPYVEGETLADKLQREKQLSIEESIKIVRHVSAALDYAHEHGIVHRDVKPANILLQRDEAVVADFGIALAVEVAGGERLTGTGLSLGTPEYMSPEQATGDRQVDSRSDVYSLGCVLYEMLAGEPPHIGKNVQSVIAKVLTDKATDVRATRDTVPPHVAAAVAKALNKVPGDRFPTAGALAKALRQSRAIAMPSVKLGKALWRRIFATAAVVALLAAVTTWFLIRTKTGLEMAGDTGRLSLLLSSDEPAFDPALSPDGKMIAYVTSEAGQVDLFVRMVQGGQPVRVTNDDALEATPVFSPDGERIAFTRRDSTDSDRAIWVIPTLGGEATAIAANARMPAWSYDGSHLVYVETLPGQLSSLVVVSLDREERTVVFEDSSPYLALYSPTWSPDGNLLAVSRSVGGNAGEIWLVSVNGESPRRLSHDPPGVVAHDPVFTPDGEGIVYSSNRAGTINLWLLPVDGGEPVRLTTGGGPDEAPSIANDGTIAFVNSRWRQRLLLFDLETNQQRTLHTHRDFIWAPAFSPDGTEIAFSRNEVDGSWHIWIVGVDGQGIRRLTSGSPPQMYPRFTPDGEWVVYLAWSTPGRVWRVPRRGGPPVPMTPEGEDAGYADISPDQTQIAYVRAEGGTTHIYIAPLDGGEARQLTDSPGTLPRWSPDGQWIAFTPDRSFAGGVFVIRSDGTGERRLTDTGGWHAWMPDGSQIGYLIVGPEGNQQLYVVPLASGAPVQIPQVDYDATNSPFDV